MKHADFAARMANPDIYMGFRQLMNVSSELSKAEGKQVTISLLEAAMLKEGKQQVLIDGFPRNEENRAAFESQVSCCRRHICTEKLLPMLLALLHTTGSCNT